MAQFFLNLALDLAHNSLALCRASSLELSRISFLRLPHQLPLKDLASL